MKYDAFISYSRVDVDWARRLQDSLKARGIEAFRDEDRLRPGDKWDTQLQEAISDSRHLVVLWSPQAGTSDWVQEERIYFLADVKGSEVARRAVFVNLEGRNRAVSSFEQIDNISKAGLYAAGAAALEANPHVWKRVLDKLEETLKEDDSQPIYKVVLAASVDALHAIPLTAKPNLAPSFGDTLEALGLKRDASDDWKKEVSKYYGPKRSDWMPFGGPRTIDVLLDHLRDRLQDVSGAPRFRWREVDDEFWTDDPEVLEGEVRNIALHSALVIIDPLSLYDPLTASRLPTLRAMLRPSRVATAVLAPFAIPSVNSHIRRLLRGAVVELFNQYYEPSFNGSSLYPVNVCAHDELDVRRVLWASLDAQSLRQDSRLSPGYTGMRR